MTQAANDGRAMDAARAMDAFVSGDAPTDLNLAEVMAALITSLRHYADRHGIDFARVLAGSDAAYAGQHASEHGHGVGQEVRIRTGTVPGPAADGLPAVGVIAAVQLDRDGARTYAIRFPGDSDAILFTGDEIEAAPSFRPLLTSRGMVRTVTEAEHLLADTAARIQLRMLRNAPPPWAYISDRGRLSAAIGAMYGISAGEVLHEFAPQVAARVGDLQAIAAASELGSAHGEARIEPFGDLDAHGDAEARLMGALGETGPTTAANHPRRVAMLSAYRDAYDSEQARVEGGSSAGTAAAAGSPAQLTGRDFPQQPGESLTATARDPVVSSDSPRTRPSAHPEQGRREHPQ